MVSLIVLIKYLFLCCGLTFGGRELADVNKDYRLNQEEFAVVLHLIEKTKLGHPIPRTLPESLVPPASRPAAISSSNSNQSQTLEDVVSHLASTYPINQVFNVEFTRLAHRPSRYTYYSKFQSSPYNYQLSSNHHRTHSFPPKHTTLHATPPPTTQSTPTVHPSLPRPFSNTHAYSFRICTSCPQSTIIIISGNVLSESPSSPDTGGLGLGCVTCGEGEIG